MSLQEDDAFGSLRSLTQSPPSVAGFAKICRGIERMELAQPGLFDQRYRGYVVGALGAWPRRRRLLTLDVEPRRVAGRAWGPLARSVHLNAGRGDRFDGLLDGLEAVEHLTLSCDVKQKALLGAIDEGLFDGLRSIEFDGMPLRAKLFEEIVARLSTREGCAELEELRFTRCNIKKAHVEALCASPLPERLRTLGLSHNTSLKTTGVQVITGAAARFERLERLELHEAALKAPAAKAIARAAWASPLEYIGLYGNPLKPAAFEELDAAELLPAIVDRQGAPVFDLSGYELDAAALTRFLERGLFDELDTLCCRSAYGAEGWEVLTDEVPRLGRLRSFVSGAPGLHDPLVGPLLEASRLERLDLSGHARCIDDVALAELLRDQDALAYLRLSWGSMTEDYGAEGLEAMMSWGRWDEVDDVHVSFRVPEDHRLYGDLASHPRFRLDHQNTAMGPRYNTSPGGSSYDVGNHCVRLDGRTSSAWFRRRARQEG